MQIPYNGKHMAQVKTPSDKDEIYLAELLAKRMP